MQAKSKNNNNNNNNNNNKTKTNKQKMGGSIAQFCPTCRTLAIKNTITFVKLPCDIRFKAINNLANINVLKILSLK